MSTSTTIIGGEQEAPPTLWNGVALGRDTNRVALQWAYERIPHLIELGYSHLHGWVLVALSKRTKLNGDNKVWPSQKTIATEIGMKPRSVRYTLDDLEQGGVIECGKIPNGNHNLYKILPEVDGHQWKPWVTCKPCNVANGAILQTVQGVSGKPCTSMWQTVHIDVANGAPEQEKGTSEDEQEYLNRRTTLHSSSDDDSAAEEKRREGTRETTRTYSKPLTFAGPNQSLKPQQTPTPVGYRRQPVSEPEQSKTETPASLRTRDTTAAPPLNVVPLAAALAPYPSTPGGRIAEAYYLALSRPPAHRQAARTTWPVVMEDLLADYTEEDLLAATDWAINVDSFWPGPILRASNPAEYFRAKADKIIPKWRGVAKAAANAAKASKSTSGFVGEATSERPSWSYIEDNAF